MKFGKNWLVVMVIFVLCNCNTKAQIFEWAKSMSGNVTGRAISTDANGNCYITGFFYGTATFGTTEITSSSEMYEDIFIAKYDPNGNFQWVKKAGGTSDDYGNGISTDANGNCYISGYFNGTATFGTTQITSSGGYDIFTAKYDANGNFLWVQKAGGTNVDRGEAISTDANGNCYVTGCFGGTATFGSTQITSSGSYDIFIAKYDASGNFKWVQKAGGTYDDYGNGISTDANGNCYIAGYFNGTATFGTTQVTSSGGYDIFIAKYDASGNFKWVQKAGGTDDDRDKAISTDANGNCYVTGYFYGTATFGSMQISNSGEKDIFIAKYDPNGNFQWVQKAGGTSDDYGYGISTDANENCYVTGYFYGTATFDSTQITNSGEKDIFIAKYDPNGNFKWVQKAGGTSGDYGYGISSDANENCYVTGYFYSSPSDFGNITLTSGSGFITKLAPPTLNISSPTGGEVWQTNTVHNITWNTNTYDGNIKIEITTNDGANWFTLQSNVQASPGNFTLTIPPYQNSDQCRIRLTSLTWGNVRTSGLFTITSANVPNLTITSPNTSVKWNVDSSQSISWITTESIIDVKLEYTTDNGNSWITIAASAPASTGSYNWIIPHTPSTKCRVRISDVSNSLINDVSDELFTIVIISITAPTEGEKWRAQTQRQIKWNSTDISNIKLYYTTDNGESWKTISSSVSANNESYYWSIPNVESSECRIKIEDNSDTTVFCISDIFEIWKPIVSTQTLPTGQITQSFGSTNITLSAFVLNSAPVTVEYYPYESPNTGTLPSGVVEISKYYWDIKSASLSFNNGVISVPISTLLNVNDPTKLVWLKRPNSTYDWTNIGGSISGGNLLSVDGFNSFSQFTIGIIDSSNLVSVELSSSDIPKEYSLDQNYPNPFNPSTVIKYQLPKSEFVTLKVYDILGNEVASLVNREQSAGSYEVTFDGSNLASGIYLYQLRAGEFVRSKKLILMK